MSDKKQKVGFPPKGELKHLDAVFSSQRIPLLHMFCSDEQSEAISGIHVQQHPEGGALLCALDGHMACLAHDPNGWARQPANFYPTREMVTYCGKRQGGKVLERVGLELGKGDSRSGIAYLSRDDKFMPSDLRFIQPSAADKRAYPDFTSFMSKALHTRKLDINELGFPLRAMSVFGKLPSEHSGGVFRSGKSPDDPLFVATPGLPGVIVCVMPMNVDPDGENPIERELVWLRSAMEKTGRKAKVA